MQPGMIGLGRMGADMVRRLSHGGQRCVVFDVQSASVQRLQQEGIAGASTLEDLVARLEKPRRVTHGACGRGRFDLRKTGAAA
ncbi:hypothetical protein PTKU46_91560 [Paraburkholderia terrae]